MRNNLKVRKALREMKVKQYDIADEFGVSASTFSRWLKEELPEDEQDRIISIIREKAGHGE